jgi:hypothetical protein
MNWLKALVMTPCSFSGQHVMVLKDSALFSHYACKGCGKKMFDAQQIEENLGGWATNKRPDSQEKLENQK